MTLKLKLLCRVVRRRMERGEELPAVFHQNDKARRFMEFALHFLGKCATLKLDKALNLLTIYMMRRSGLRGEAARNTGYR